MAMAPRYDRGSSVVNVLIKSFQDHFYFELLDSQISLYRGLMHQNMGWNSVRNPKMLIDIVWLWCTILHDVIFFVLKTGRKHWWNTCETLVKHLWNTGETSCLECSKVKIRLHTDGRRNALIDIVTSWAAHCSWEHGKDIDQPKVGQGPRSITKIGLLNHHQFFGANIFKIKEFFRHKDFFDQHFVSKLFWF